VLFWGQVVYSWVSNQDAGSDVFTINSHTGEVTTKRMLDRETQDTYVLNIMASDNYPSAIKPDGSPNNSTCRNVKSYCLVLSFGR
jgi:hypothetical protein